MLLINYYGGLAIKSTHNKVWFVFHSDTVELQWQVSALGGGTHSFSFQCDICNWQLLLIFNTLLSVKITVDCLLRHICMNLRISSVEECSFPVMKPLMLTYFGY